MGVSGYIRAGFVIEGRKKILADAVKKLKGQSFDAIACRGVSGLMYAPILTYLLRKHLIVVRKQMSGSHAGVIVETLISKGSYIIVDDFSATGATIRTIVEKLKEHHPKLTCVGAYMWEGNNSNDTNITLTDLKIPCLSGKGKIK